MRIVAGVLWVSLMVVPSVGWSAAAQAPTRTIQIIGAMGVSGADGEKCAQAAIDTVFKKPAAPSR